MRIAAVTAVALAFCGRPVAADDYQPIPDDRVEAIGKGLSELAAKVKEPPAKFEFDPSKARGLYDPGNNRGLAIVPIKDLKSEPDNPDLTKDKGKAIGGVFFYNVLPTGVSGKDKLFKIDFKDAEGEREVRFAVVTVRKKSDQEYFLQLWGSDKEVLCEAQLGEMEGDEKHSLDIAIANSELTFKLLGKYGTKLGIKEATF